MIENSELDDKSLEKPTTSRIRTRLSTVHPIFGTPLDLPSNVLPTIGQVARYFVLLKEKPNSSNKAVIGRIADDVINRWNFANKLFDICSCTCKISLDFQTEEISGKCT